jgi:hypothetical protein
MGVEMLVIAHRGNLNGPNPRLENKPSYIQKAINKGFQVEIDVWCMGNKWYLGHDKPQYLIDFTWLDKRYNDLWIHCKNIKAMHELLKHGGIFYFFKFFFHQNDDFTLTSNGKLWINVNYNGKLTKDCIVCDFNNSRKVDNIYGVCTDFPSKI